LESDLASLRHRCRELELWLTETTQQFDVEYAEWLQLQKDLQVAVVVANDFRTEAQHSFDTVLAENQSLRDRVASLTKELAEVHHQLAATSKYLLCLNIIDKLLFYSSLRVCKSPCSEPVAMF